MSEYTETTLAAAVTKTTDKITVASATGITAGNPLTGTPPSYIYVDREFMKVIGVSGTTITVERGTHPGIVSGHASGAAVYIGGPDMFAYRDYAGYEASPSQAYIINVITGEMFFNSAGQWYGSKEGWGQSTV